MQKEMDELKKKFYEIKNKEWIESAREDFGGIGITFEKLLGIESNELEIPDFGEIEIKTKTCGSNSQTTLFNCVPTGPHYHEVERLKELYGYPDSILKSSNVLNVELKCNKMVKIKTNFYFMIKINYESKKIYLFIYNKNKSLIEKSVYWDFDILEEKLYRKLKYLAIVMAKKKLINGKKYFKYYKMEVLRLKSFETFIKLIENGDVNISFKIGVFRTGKKAGKIHDHGTSFVIGEYNIHKLYERIELYY